MPLQKTPPAHQLRNLEIVRHWIVVDIIKLHELEINFICIWKV